MKKQLQIPEDFKRRLDAGEFTPFQVPEQLRIFWVFKTKDGYFVANQELSEMEELTLDNAPSDWIIEVEEPIDLNQVMVDAPVEVYKDGHGWIRRYFACAKNGKIYCWFDGKTSWTENGTLDHREWRIPADMDPEQWKRDWVKGE